ncbi:MAG: hypothetical protein ACI9WU_003686 [Myxococcota bacterium]|jgi:hypothetical protein
MANGKTIGLILVTVGVAIAAAFGARNPTEVHTRLETRGKASLLTDRADKAFVAYCEKRTEAKLPLADGCPDPEAKAEAKPAPKAAEPEVAAKTPTRDELLSAARAQLAGLKASKETLAKPLATARADWLVALETAMEPVADAGALPPAPAGVDRLSSWLGSSGAGTALGLVLIIAGALIARAAQRAEAESEAPATPGDSGRPRDFGEILAALQTDLATLSADMSAEEEPDAATIDTVKGRLEGLQFDLVEPLTDSGARLQARFGVAGFAAIFSPLSGGERNLNRAWCALVDDHWPEACRSVNSARSLFVIASEELDRQTRA